MADFAWLLHRLKAMSIPEVAWRVWQKIIEKNEKLKYGANLSSVVSYGFHKEYEKLRIDPDRMQLNLENQCFGLDRRISLLGGYDYEVYRKQWNAGFQTDKLWEPTVSYNLSYKQRDEIGDARTNWELNRHFQFAMLAKDYYASANKTYLNEFVDLFTDWNEKNPFLHGISWTSVMEVAIRASNWCYAYCFLAKAKETPQSVLRQLQTGIVNMTDYVVQHYSRYSSANNHLIVEAYAIGQTGILTGYQPWVDLSVNLLTRELPLQNYSDGINKELSLHYQGLYMEAMGLMMRLMVKNGIIVPDSWYLMLSKMSEYVANCMGQYGEVIEFGDNDEGRILALSNHFNYYQYVLGMMSLLLTTQYIEMENCCENLIWLFTEDEKAQKKEKYQSDCSVCYSEGGNTILKSLDGRILIGIDHAELGFGSIAAHGHADALSFQMYVDGIPMFVDPGTYIYHSDIENRNAFRRTENHNTVCVEGKDQSEMLGAFLWGKMATCKLLKHDISTEKCVIEAEHDGYAPTIHRRRFEFVGNSLTITDTVSDEKKAEANFMLGAGLVPVIDKNIVEIKGTGASVLLETDGKINIADSQVSYTYGKCLETKVLRIKFNKAVKVRITVGDVK